MSRDWLLYLDDIIESAEKIGRLLRGRSYDAFIADEAVFDAVLFNLQVIGEAAKRLPDIARVSLPEVDWSGAIARFHRAPLLFRGRQDRLGCSGQPRAGDSVDGANFARPF